MASRPPRVVASPADVVAVPEALVHQLGVASADDLVVLVQEGKLVIQSRDSVLAELQAMFADYEGSLVDELIAERREAARLEADVPLVEAAVGPLLRGRYGRQYAWRESCSSTQLLLGPDDPDGAVAVAEEQTAGRGRIGRVWETPPGLAILVSVLLRPPAGRPPAQLSVVAGVAVARAVDEALRSSGAAGPGALPSPAAIKWPNDVLLGGRKTCGILAEARGGVVILGIGLNVNQLPADLPPTQRLPPTSLRLERAAALALAPEAAPALERAPILAELLWELELAVEAWAGGGLEALHGELSARDFLAGREIVLDGAPARALGIDGSGSLAVDVAGERRLVDSGEILLAGPAAPA